MGDQNCSLAILARARPDLAIDAGVRVLCVDYLLVKQNSQSFQLRLSLGYQNLLLFSLSLSLLKAHQILCFQRICHHCFKAGHLRLKCPDLGKKPAAAGGSYYVEVCSQDLGWVGAANLPEENLLGEEGVSQEEILNFWRGDGGGDAKQESGDFCGWVGEILTPIILLRDRLIGDEGGEEFLEEEKEGVSFSSPEIPRGGNKEGENFVGMVEGKREISSSPPGGESSDRGGDFSKEEFSPTTERGGSEGGGSSLLEVKKLWDCWIQGLLISW